MARPRTRDFTRGEIEACAAALRVYILDNDLKNFEEMIGIMRYQNGTAFLKAVINHNFLNASENCFTAVQAATITAIATGEVDILSRLIDLGAEVTWDTSCYSYAFSSDDMRNTAHYQGDALSGDSVYESFQRTFSNGNLNHEIEQALIKMVNVEAVQLSKQIKEALEDINFPSDVSKIICQFTGAEGSMANLLHHRGVYWMRELHNQVSFDRFAAQFRDQHPDCDDTGYGPGALVVYKP